jgi:hypothetical protein
MSGKGVNEELEGKEKREVVCLIEKMEVLGNLEVVHPRCV